MKQFWHCAAAWLATPVTCTESGEGDSGAEKHTRATGHPTVTTTRPDWDPFAHADTSVWCQDNRHERCKGPDGCDCTCHTREDQ